MSIEAMKQALEALEEYQAKGPPFMSCDAAVAALRAAIEQYDQTSLELCEECNWRALIPGDGCLVCARQKAKRQWVGLTTQEILEIVDDHTEIRGSLPMLYRDQAVDLARDIEAKLKQKNA